MYFVVLVCFHLCVLFSFSLAYITTRIIYRIIYRSVFMSIFICFVLLSFDFFFLSFFICCTITFPLILSFTSIIKLYSGSRWPSNFILFVLTTSMIRFRVLYRISYLTYKHVCVYHSNVVSLNLIFA